MATGLKFIGAGSAFCGKTPSAIQNTIIPSVGHVNKMYNISVVTRYC